MHERDLQADQHADDAARARTARSGTTASPSECRGTAPRHQPADQADQQLDAQEVRDQLALEVARQPRADAHREQVGADDGRELGDRVAEQVAGQRPAASS